MQSTISLINRLRRDFPEFSFEEADMFWWSAKDRVVHVDPRADNASAFCLHEVSHAILEHNGYVYDIDLVKLERQAWEYAVHELGARYEIAVDDEIVQHNLDTYREWLHARSRCPECDSTGLQTKLQHYRCLACRHLWYVNEARICALRRYSLVTK